MWANFFLQEEDRRRRARGQQQAPPTPEREAKVKLGLLLSAVGAALSVLAVGTEFWVELNTYKANGSVVCDAAHLGLWKMCTRRLWQASVPAGRDTCGPAQLPGGERPRPGRAGARAPRGGRSPSTASPCAPRNDLGSRLKPGGRALGGRESLYFQTPAACRPACTPPPQQPVPSATLRFSLPGPPH